MTYRYPQRPSTSISDLFETTQVWSTGYSTSYYTTTCNCGFKHRMSIKRPKGKGQWVCRHCGAKTQTKYIATGHDHTDYRYDTCSCDGARKHGKPWVQLTWPMKPRRTKARRPQPDTQIRLLVELANLLYSIPRWTPNWRNDEHYAGIEGALEAVDTASGGVLARYRAWKALNRPVVDQINRELGAIEEDGPVREDDES